MLQDVLHKKKGTKLSEHVKIALRKKVEKYTTRKKAVTNKDAIKWCDREQCAAFLKHDRLWPEEEGLKYYDIQCDRRLKGKSEHPWRAHKKNPLFMLIGMEMPSEMNVTDEIADTTQANGPNKFVNLLQMGGSDFNATGSNFLNPQASSSDSILSAPVRDDDDGVFEGGEKGARPSSLRRGDASESSGASRRQLPPVAKVGHGRVNGNRVHPYASIVSPYIMYKLKGTTSCFKTTRCFLMF